MAHTIAGETFPLQVLRDESSPGARWIAKVVEGLALTIVRQCGDGWNVVAPGEPIVRTAIPRDPQKYQPSTNQLPALFAWVDGATPIVTERVAADITVRRYALKVMWVPPPAQWGTAEKWSNFWVAVDQALNLALGTAYSPWTTASALGLTIVDAASLWELTLGQGGFEPLQLNAAAGVVEFDAYIWRLNASTRVGFDILAEPTPTVPNKIEANINGGTDGSWPLQSLKPPELWEE